MPLANYFPTGVLRLGEKLFGPILCHFPPNLQLITDRFDAFLRPADADRVTSRAPSAPGRDAFIYFDNDAKVHAPFDAVRLRQRLDGV